MNQKTTLSQRVARRFYDARRDREREGPILPSDTDIARQSAQRQPKNFDQPNNRSDDDQHQTENDDPLADHAGPQETARPIQFPVLVSVT